MLQPPCNYVSLCEMRFPIDMRPRKFVGNTNSQVILFRPYLTQLFGNFSAMQLLRLPASQDYKYKSAC